MNSIKSSREYFKASFERVQKELSKTKEKMANYANKWSKEAKVSKSLCVTISMLKTDNKVLQPQLEHKTKKTQDNEEELK